MMTDRYSFVCKEGCGECQVKLMPFEYSRTETLEGELLESKVHPQVVSACCGNGVGVYDNVADKWLDDAVDLVTPTPAASGAAPADSRVSVASILRAMALNYTARHSWDHLDADACRKGADEIDRLAALASREASPAPLTETPQELERALGQAIDERDERDEVIDALCDAVLGKHRAEWSSMYGFRDAVSEVEEHMAALASPQVAPAPEPVKLQHMAVSEDGVLRWMSGRKAVDCELYAMPDFGRAPPLYLATPVQVAPEGDAHLAAVKIEPLPFYHEWFNSKNWGGGNTQGAFIAGWFKAINELRLRGLLAAPVAPQDDARDAARSSLREPLTVIRGHLKSAALKLERAHKKSPESWIGFHDDAFLQVEYAAQELMKVLATLPPSAPAAKPTEPTLPTQGDAK